VCGLYGHIHVLHCQVADLVASPACHALHADWEAQQLMYDLLDCEKRCGRGVHKTRVLSRLCMQLLRGSLPQSSLCVSLATVACLQIVQFRLCQTLAAIVSGPTPAAARWTLGAVCFC
jgi:hypothetical protein